MQVTVQRIRVITDVLAKPRANAIPARGRLKARMAGMGLPGKVPDIRLPFGPEEDPSQRKIHLPLIFLVFILLNEPSLK